MSLDEMCSDGGIFKHQLPVNVTHDMVEKVSKVIKFDFDSGLFLVVVAHAEVLAHEAADVEVLRCGQRCCLQDLATKIKYVEGSWTVSIITVFGRC